MGYTQWGHKELDTTERLILPYKYLMYLSDFGDRLSCTMVLQFLIFVMGFIFWIVSFY